MPRYAPISRTRYPQTLVHGRHSTPAEVLLRLLLVKHLYDWSYRETEARVVADSLVLRWFCRVYFRPVPDATTLLRWAQTIRPETLHALNDRVVQLAHQARVTSGRKLRIDGTAVQTVIHHPTDSSLLADGVRVLSRLIRRSKPVVQGALRGRARRLPHADAHDARRVANPASAAAADRRRPYGAPGRGLHETRGGDAGNGDASTACARRAARRGQRSRGAGRPPARRRSRGTSRWSSR